MRFDLSFVTESAVQQEPVQFNTPEPYKQSEASAIADNSLEDGDETLDTSNSEVKSTLWQTLNDRTSTSQKPPKNSQSPATATDRMDMDVDYSDLQDQELSYQPQLQPQDLSYIIQKNVFRPNLVPSIPDPRYPQLTPEIQSRSSTNHNSAASKNGAKLMSAFLEAPGPRFDSPLQPSSPNVNPTFTSAHWANSNGFLPTKSNQMLISQANNNARNTDMSVRVTPRSEKPNTIPMKVHHLFSSPKPKPRTTTTIKPKQPAIDFDPPKNMEKFTAQQIIRQQIQNRLQQVSNQQVG